MKADKDIAKARLTIDEAMRAIDARTIDPYSAGLTIWEMAMAHVSSSADEMHPLWLIWGSLTDWIENKPEERAITEETMRRAAKEWITLAPGNSTARKAYLDRWVYDEMGYERKRTLPSK